MATNNDPRVEIVARALVARMDDPALSANHFRIYLDDAIAILAALDAARQAEELCCDPRRYDRGECIGLECPKGPWLAKLDAAPTTAGVFDDDQPVAVVVPADTVRDAAPDMLAALKALEYLFAGESDALRKRFGDARAHARRAIARAEGRT